MPDSSLTAILLTYGPLGVFAVLLAVGWLVPKPFIVKAEQKHAEEIRQLQGALEHERQANNELRSTGTVTNQLIGALVDVAHDRQKARSLQSKSAGGAEPSATRRTDA